MNTEMTVGVLRKSMDNMAKKKRGPNDLNIRDLFPQVQNIIPSVFKN
jgi:hypothetical protein